MILPGAFYRKAAKERKLHLDPMSFNYVKTTHVTIALKTLQCTKSNIEERRLTIGQTPLQPLTAGGFRRRSMIPS